VERKVKLLVTALLINSTGKLVRTFALKHQYRKLLKSRDNQTVYLSQPYPNEQASSLSPFAVFSISSFLKNAQECVTYAAEVQYPPSNEINSTRFQNTVADCILETANEVLLVNANKPLMSRVSGTTVTGNTFTKLLNNYFKAKFDLISIHWHGDIGSNLILILLISRLEMW
jgi:hypothetical protein